MFFKSIWNPQNCDMYYSWTFVIFFFFSHPSLPFTMVAIVIAVSLSWRWLYYSPLIEEIKEFYISASQLKGVMLIPSSSFKPSSFHLFYYPLPYHHIKSPCFISFYEKSPKALLLSFIITGSGSCLFFLFSCHKTLFYRRRHSCVYRERVRF